MPLPHVSPYIMIPVGPDIVFRDILRPAGDPLRDPAARRKIYMVPGGD